MSRPAALLAVPLAILVIYAFPGLMSVDSLDQLAEARAGDYTDWHPPVMAVLWQAIDGVVPGPFGMLVLQGALVLGGLYALLRRAAGPATAARLVSAVMLYPPVFAPLAVIWKDCLMAGCLLVGAAALLSASRRVRIAGLGALWLATAVRYNALAATLPLVVLLFEWAPMPPVRRYLIATAVWLALSASALGANAALADHAMHPWHSTLAVMDIAGTLHYLDDDLPDAELRDALRGTGVRVDRGIHAAIRARYAPHNFQSLVRGDDAPWQLVFSGTTPVPADQRAALEHAWRSVVGAHSLAYLRARWQTFATLLGLTRREPSSTVYRHERQDPGRLVTAGAATHASGLQVAMGDGLRDVAKLQIFRPFLYVLLALGLLVVARRQRDVVALLLSGLLTEASLFVLAASVDYRYSHWLVVCTWLSLVIAVVRWRRERARG